jgi:hypothetical protein
MHFGEGKAELFPLGENVFMPEIFYVIGLGKSNIVDMNRWALLRIDPVSAISE